jgi:hypothetical protein
MCQLQLTMCAYYLIASFFKQVILVVESSGKLFCGV